MSDSLMSIPPAVEGVQPEDLSERSQSATNRTAQSEKTEVEDKPKPETPMQQLRRWQQTLFFAARAGNLMKVMQVLQFSDSAAGKHLYNDFTSTTAKSTEAAPSASKAPAQQPSSTTTDAAASSNAEPPPTSAESSSPPKSQDPALVELRSMLLEWENPRFREPTDAMTCLQQACASGSGEVMLLLLDHGAKVNHANISGLTPLHFAAKFGFEDMCQILVEEGADPQAVNKCDWTPMHLAAQNGHSPVISLLTHQGGDVNAVTIRGFTPGHMAAMGGHVAALRTLANAEANFTLRNQYSKTVLDLSERRKHPEAAAFVAKYIRGLQTTTSEPGGL